MSENRNTRRQLQGVVTSDKATQTITVSVERTFRHPKYGKYVRVRKKFMAHDPEDSARSGDLVEIAATRPLSKRKRWRLVKVLERPELTDALPSTEIVTAEGGES